MPTYYSRKTSIQLAIADLRDTTTISPESRSHSAVHYEVSNCAAKFARASINGTLDETPIFTEDANQTHVRALGKFSETPFFIVRAGMSIFRSELEGRRSRRPARVPPSIKSPVSMPQNSTSLMSSSTPAIPHALFLSVFLSKASFLPTYVHHLNKTIFHDVKIDVFFNGEICASAYVSGRFHSDTYETTEHIIRFSGRRVHRLLEKPWILVPPGQHADGRSRPERYNMRLSGDAKQRWASVSEALLMEADRLEKRRNGELSKLGDYLSALATLQMPTEVEAMQMVGDPKIGIIDVVITAGKGQKDHANALRLMRPTPMRLEEPKEPSAPRVLDNGQDRSVSEGRFVRQEVITEAQSPNSTLDETFTTPTKERRWLGSRADSDILAQGFTFEARGLRSQSELANDPVRGGNHARPLGSEGALSNDLLTKNPHKNSPFKFQSSSTKPTPRKNNELRSDQAQEKLPSPQVNLSNASQGTSGRPPDPKSAQPKCVAPVAFMGNSAGPRQRSGRNAWGNWEIVVDDKLTLEEEMESIAAEAARATSKMFIQPSASSHARRTTAKNPSGFNEQRSLLRQTGNSKRRKLYIEVASDSDDDDIDIDIDNNDNNALANEPIPPKKKSLIVKLKIPRPKRKRPPPYQPLIPLSPAPGPGPMPEPEPKPKPPPSPIPTSPRSINRSSPLSSPASTTFSRDSLTPVFYNPFGPTPEKGPRRFNIPAYSPVSPTNTWPGTPPLSEDAVVTYAPGNALRQVKSERSGWFVEESIVMGVRFLVGGN